MDYEKMRKNNISLPDLVIDNNISKCAGESIEQKLRCGNHSGKGMQQLSKNISSPYLSASSPSHGSQPMSLPSSLPESASVEEMQNITNAALVPQANRDIQLKRPPQYTGEIGELRSIYEIPPKYRSIFSKYPSFNVIQSKALDILLYTDRPLVISAPTGSGKTAIFELAVVNLLIKLNEMNYNGDFKIVYMAPVKALCTERYHDWQEKFSPVGLKCHEVTGDSYDSCVDDLKNYNLVLTTPEKWDSLTRKWKQNKQLVQLVKLFLIDEVHLLNEDRRGPVLEAVVSRMKTVQETLSYSKHSSAQDAQIKVPIRFIAVSATIPNIEDLADWLGDGIRPAEFIKIGEEYRPVKLNKVVLGFPTSLQQNPFMFDMNLNYRLRDLLFKYAEGKPTLIFCSTRKGVTQTAQTLAKEITFHFNVQQRESLLYSAKNLVDKKLRDTVLAGVGSHHAGMDASDRHTTEDLFRRLLLPVLVTTSTLAMGVNLPAHLVIVKSTQQYIGGFYQDYSETQLLQMIGRAGRPQFDKTATAIIMTRQQDKERYERLVDGRDLIESTLHRHLAEHLNSEVVLETITDVCIAMNWLRSTFLYVRALKNPAHYGFSKGMSETEITKKLQDLCLYEMNGLASANLVTVINGLDIRPTDNGRLMASFYMSVETMKNYNKITGTESLNDMILVLASSHEFSELQLRRVEKRVLNALNKIKDRECIRFPIKGVVKDVPMKVNVLTQATFGCLPINDHSLYQDSLKIMRVGERISRCLTKYLQNTGHYRSLLNGVLLAKCYSSKLWENSIYVTKQLPGIGAAYSNLLASAGKTTFDSVVISNPRDLERILNKAPPLGNELKKAVIHLPKYSVEMNLNDANTEGTMTLRLENVDDISEFSTAGARHWLTIIVGDNTNKVLHHERLNDNQLIQMDGVVSWCFSIDSTDVNEIYGHVISDHWVGIDVNVMVAVAQVGRTSRNIMMKKAIEQYVTKMGLPNPLSDKKENAKPTKPKKLTIVEQIRQKGRQLPELGVKIGNLNVNTTTPLKQSSLDRFLYTPAKKLKLPLTYAQFINQNGAVGSVTKNHNFIGDNLPPIYSDAHGEISCPSATQTLDIVDSCSKFSRPLSCIDEDYSERGRTGAKNQSRQDVYIQDTQPYHDEQQEPYTLNPLSYNTREDTLHDMEVTTIGDQTNIEENYDHTCPQRQSPLLFCSMGESTRDCGVRNECVKAISSEDDEEVKWVNTYQLEDQGSPISERRNSYMKDDANIQNEQKYTSSVDHYYWTGSKKMQPKVYSVPQKGQGKYLGSAFNNSVPNYIEMKQPSCAVNVSKTPMLATHSIHRDLPTQNYRKTLHYANCNKEDAQARVDSYTESKSEYLQRMKEHFADFQSINENCDSETKDEKTLFLARNRLLTEYPQPPTYKNEWYARHDGGAERNKSCEVNCMPDATSNENKQHEPFSVTPNQYNCNPDAPDVLQSSCSPQKIQENDLSQSDYHSITECEQEQLNFPYEKEFSQRHRDPGLQDTQSLMNIFRDENLKKGGGEKPSNNFNQTENQQFGDCNDDDECRKIQSQDGTSLAREEQDLTLKNCITFTQVQDSHTLQDGLHLESFNTRKNTIANDVTDITIRDHSNVISQLEARDDDDFVESTPDQRKENSSVKILPEQSEISLQADDGQSQARAQSNECGASDEKNSQDHCCQEMDKSKHGDSSDALHRPLEGEKLKENKEIKSPAYDSVKMISSVEEIKVSGSFREESEVRNKENAEHTILELKNKPLNEKEIGFGEHGIWGKVEPQFKKQEEIGLKNKTLDRDELKEKLNIPKHHFPIFINYELNVDEGSLKKKQKLDFIFAGKNCSPQGADWDAVPKITCDSSAVDIYPARTNVRPAYNVPSKDTGSKLNPENISKSAFDMDIDSLLDSIDATDIDTCITKIECSPNMKKIPIKNKSKPKDKKAVCRSAKRSWDASDPLMVLFYGPRMKQMDKLPIGEDCKASTNNLANSAALEDPPFVKHTAPDVKSAELLSSENKNPNSKELDKSSVVISRKENIRKPAPQEKLFAYCKGRPDASRDLDRKLSEETVNIKDIAKVPKIAETSTMCQQGKKFENLAMSNIPAKAQNFHSSFSESLNHAISVPKYSEGFVPCQGRPQKNVALIHQNMTQVSNSLRALSLPGVLNCNTTMTVQEMKSCTKEAFKPATNAGSANKGDRKARDTESNSIEAKGTERFHEVTNAVAQTKPMSMFQYAVGGQQNMHGKILKPLPPNAMEIMNVETQTFRLDQRKDQAHNRRESNLSAHKKVSTREEVFKIHETNLSCKGIVSPSKSTLQKTFDVQGDQNSNRTWPREQINVHTPKENAIKEGSKNSSTLTSVHRHEKAQIPSHQRQYLNLEKCNFEETCGYNSASENFERMEPCQQTNGRSTRVIHPSPESMPDIFSSQYSKHFEDKNDYDDIKESKFKWLDSQNTFTQLSDADVFSSNDCEKKYADEQLNAGDEFGSTKSQHSQQSSMPLTADSIEFNINRASDLEYVDDLSESDIPFAAKKFEYNHTQTPRRILTTDVRSSSKRMSSPLREVPYETSCRVFKNPCYERRFVGEEENDEIDFNELRKRKYQGVFEQTQNNTFKDSPARERNHKMTLNDMKVPNVRSNVGSYQFCNQTKQQDQISGEVRNDFAPLNTGTWPRDSQFQQQYESEDIDRLHKYSREHFNQLHKYEKMICGYEKQENSSQLYSRSDNIETSMRLQAVEPSRLDLSSTNLLDRRLYHHPPENYASKTLESMQRENLFQYCQKRKPGIPDPEFILSRAKQRRNF